MKHSYYYSCMKTAILVLPYSRWGYVEHHTASAIVELDSGGNLADAVTYCCLTLVSGESTAGPVVVIESTHYED